MTPELVLDLMHTPKLTRADIQAIAAALGLNPALVRAIRIDHHSITVEELHRTHIWEVAK